MLLVTVNGFASPVTTIALVHDQFFVSAPFFIRAARTGIQSVERDHEDAARVDGASERQLFATITLPLARPAIAAGLVMAWARALGEFGATIMFAGNVGGRTQTLPLVVSGAILVLAALGVLIAVRIFRWGRLVDARGLT